MRALLQLKREIGAGHPVAFALDGPRGPARVAQPGAQWLAAATGNPILPFHAEASAFWEVSSWDRTQVPKPFSKVAIAIGPPVECADASTQTSGLLIDALARAEANARDTIRAR